MSLRKCLFAVIVWQIAISAVIFISVKYLPLRDKFFGGTEMARPWDPNPFQRNPILYARANYDGISYIDISRKDRPGVNQQGYFPLYIKLLRLLNPIFKNFTFTGVFISLISFIVGLYVFTKLLAIDYPSTQIIWIVFSLLVFPTSFYFSFVYTEGLFFLLSVSSFYFFRKKNYLISGILGGLASYTRIIGFLIFPAIVLELIISSKKAKLSLISELKKSIALLLIPLGLLVFMVQLQITNHDPLSFIHVQSSFAQGRSEHPILLPQVFWRYIKIIFTMNKSDPLFYTILLEAFSGLSFLALSIYSFIKHKISYSLFNFLAYLLPTLTGTFTSLPRYVLACFPAFVIIGVALSKSKIWQKVLYLIISCSLSVLYISFFVRGYWVS